MLETSLVRNNNVQVLPMFEPKFTVWCYTNYTKDLRKYLASVTISASFDNMLRSQIKNTVCELIESEKSVNTPYIKNIQLIAPLQKYTIAW